jgi:hypothetical protein
VTERILETPSYPCWRRPSFSAPPVVLCLFALGCSSPSKDSNNNSDNDGGDSGQTTIDPNTLVGTFQVRLVAAVPATATEPETPGYTAVIGKVYDGETPAQIQFNEGAVVGACKLLTPYAPYCETPCGTSAACVADNQCQRYPAAHSVGTVHMSGIHTAAGASEISMEPIANGYQPSETLPYPAFTEGEVIALDAAGSAFVGAFSVSSRGVGPLEVLNDTVTLADNTPVTLTWTPPGQAGLATIHVKLDISHHGGVKGKIECDAEDTGSLEIAATLVNELKALGIAGFPTIAITRSARGATPTAIGRVDLAVTSDVEMAVDIPGLVSCNEDDDCPEPETCRTDMVCR